MPILTRWFLKAALLYLAAALFISLLLALRTVITLPAIVGALAPVYIHLYLVGWVGQLICGIAFWMFPKFSPAQPRGNEKLGWATLGLLNIGLLLRAIGEPLVMTGGARWGGLLVLSAGLQWLGMLAFVVNTWPRVKEK